MSTDPSRVSEIEARIASIWRELLRLETVAPDASFFELGGDSLRAAEAVARVEDEFEVVLELEAIFAEPTIAGAARLVVAQLSETAPVDGEGEHGAPSADRIAVVEAAQRGESHPVSRAQESILLFEQLHPGTSVYHVSVCLRIDGPLDLEMFGRALETVLREHEGLRTSFSHDGVRGWQTVRPASAFALRRRSVEELPEDVRFEAAVAEARADAEAPFDLSRAKLVRGLVVRVTADCLLFCLTAHHIATDGHSLGLLAGRLGALYSSLVAGTPDTTTARALDYLDFAVWDRAPGREAARRTALDYWTSRLDGAELKLALPVDRDREGRSFDGATRRVSLGPTVTAAVRDAAKAFDATPFAVLFAAFGALLGRLSGTRDLVLGTPALGRDRAELRSVVGMFVNTLPLRVELPRGATLRSLVTSVMKATREALAHSHVRFEELVEALPHAHDPAAPPIVQAMFSLQDGVAAPPRLAGCRVAPVDLPRTVAMFDLTLELRDGPDGYEGIFEYASALFEPETVDDVAASFTTMLEAALANGDAPVDGLPILDARRRAGILALSTGERTPLLARTVDELLVRAVAEAPDAIAVVDGDRQVTYRELSGRADAVASELLRRGAKGSAVAVALPRSSDAVAAIVGVWRAGATYVPVDLSQPAERLTDILTRASCRHILTVDNDSLPGVDAIAMDDLGGSGGPFERLPSAAPAYVLFTSGSTGVPKGVVVGHASLVNVVVALAAKLDVRRGDRVLQFHSLSFDVSLEEIFLALTTGATCVLRSDEAAESTEAFNELLSRQEVSVANLPARFWSEWATSLSEKGALPRALRAVITGGEVVPPAAIATWRGLGAAPRLILAYGPTEAAVDVTFAELDSFRYATAPLGRPIANVSATVVDPETLEPLPFGVVGEIVIGGACVALGYLGDPASTAERFVVDSLRGEGRGDRLYRTGDFARLTRDGILDFRGRRDGQVKVRGFRVEPEEVERAFRALPAIEDVTVLAISRPAGSVLAAFVTLRAGATTTSEEVRARVAERLPAFMLPTRLLFLDALPLGPRGKVDRARLVAMVDADVSRTVEAPRTDVERRLVEIWRDALGVTDVGVGESLFELGGHSLTAVRVLARVRAAFEKTVTLGDLHAFPSPRALAELLETRPRHPRVLAPSATERTTGPLSFDQERMRFFEALHPGTPTYSVADAVRVEGTLSIARLKVALGALVARHEALRTVIEETPGGVVQRIVPPPRELDVESVDLRHDLGADRRAHATEAARAWLARPFDLAHAPLVRLAVFQIEDREWVLALAVHHIAVDGWSMSLVLRDLGALYDTLAWSSLEAVQKGLPPPGIRYVDYAEWQRARFERGDFEPGLSFWSTHLGDAPARIDLPTDRPYPATRAYRGSVVRSALDVRATAAVHALARSRGTTPFAVLLSAFDVLLARYSRQRDIVVGTPVANRAHPGLEETVGLFVNTVAVRTVIDDGASFADVVDRVHAARVEMAPFEDVPFEKVVERLKPERDLARPPVFQVVFVLQNVPEWSTGFSGLRLESLGLLTGTAKFELTLAAEEHLGRFQLALEYDTAIFDEATARRLLDHYVALTVNVLAEPESPVLRVPLLSADERQQLLASHATSFPVTETLHRRFQRRAVERGDAIAVEDGTRSLSYRELDARSDALARLLHAAGVRPRDLVAMQLERSVDVLVAVLGILKSGAGYVPIDPSYPADRRRYILTDSGARVVVVGVDASEDLALSSVTRVSVEDAIPGPTFAPVEMDPSDLAYVIYTSGSTGTPKGVLVEHRNVVRLFDATNAWFGFTPDDAFTLFHSISFDFSVWEIWGALLYGGRVVVVPYLASRSPEELRRIVARSGVTVLSQTPSAFRQFMLADERAMASEPGLALRFVVFGGEALDFRSLRPWFERHGDERPRLVNMYGITETTVHVTWRPLTSADAESPSSLIGTPIPDLSLHVLDEFLEPLPVGAPGEIFVGGAGVARGYLGLADVTRARFLDDPRAPGERLYRSGDLARRTARGDIEYLGRIDQQVKIRGFRIELGEIEAAISGCDGVKESVVVVREDAPGDRRLVAYVVLAGVTASDVRAVVRRTLPEYMVPAAFVELPTLPLTANGKVDRRALPKPSGERDRPYVAPATEKEIAIARAWSEVLGVPSVGAEDNFFELGGDSILTLRAMTRARELGAAHALQQLFANPTVRGLARVAKAGEDEAVTLDFVLSPEEARRVPPEVAEVHPASLLQVGMLYHAEVERHRAMYHNVSSAWVRAPFSASAMTTALAELASRHAALRTSFDLDGFGEPVALVHRTAEIPLETRDVRDLGAEDQARAVSDFLALEQSRGFAWTEAPLLRFTVHRRTDDSFQLSWSEHHAILDGWSVASLLTELFERYFACLSGRPLEIPADGFDGGRAFVALERRAIASEATRSFFRDRLADAPFTSVSSVEAAPEESSDRVRRLPLAPGAGEAIRELARRLGVTPKAVLLAAHLKSLAVLSGTTDLVTGLVVNGRPEVEGGDRALGLFLNTVPLRFALRPCSWSELVRAAFTAEGELAPHRRYPLARLQREAGRELFDTALNFVDFHVYDALGKVGGELLESWSFERTNFGLTANVAVDRFGGGLQFELIFDETKPAFHARGRIGDVYLAVISTLLAAPDESHAKRSFVGEADLARVLAPPVNEALHTSRTPEWVHERFLARARTRPEAVAVAFEGTSLSYGELARRTGSLAARLQAVGVGPETLVAVVAERSVEMVVALVAVLRAGGAYVPIDPTYPRERIEFMLADARPAVVLASASCSELARGPAETVIVLEDEIPEAEPRPVELSPSSSAYMIYTSGSTGQPKGAVNTHAGLENRLVWMQSAYALDESDRVLQKTPFSFDVSVWEFFWPLMTGAALVVAKPEGHKDPAYLADLIRAERVTTVHFVPSMLAAFVEHDDLALPSLRRVIASGEALSPELRDRFFERLDAELHNLYGPTEASIDVTAHACRPGQPPGKVPIGAPIDRMLVRVLDELMQPTVPGVPGELYLGGIGLARGYHGRPALTAERFVPDPERPGERLYRTGDVGRLLPNGELEYLGRTDDQVKIRGFRIEMGEIETALARQPGVSHVAVVARQDGGGARKLVAYLVAEGDISAERLREALSRSLPEHMVPSAFVQMAALPLSSNGKLDRKALPAPDFQAREVASYEPPRDETERLLAEAWARHLRVERVGVHDDVFQMGADSIASIQVVSAVRRRGLHITPRDLAEHPTVAGQARVATFRTAVIAEQGTVEGEVLVSPIQAWFYALPLENRDHWNQAFLLESEAPVDLQTLAAAARAVVEHHDMLRLRVSFDGPGVLQHLSGASDGAVASIDLTPGEDASAHLTRLQSSLRPHAGDVFRIALLRSPGVRDRIFLCAHHLVVDGVSWRVIIEDLATAYRAHAAGRVPDLPAKTSSFKAWAEKLPSLAAEMAEATLAAWPPPRVEERALDMDPGTEGEAVSTSITLAPEETRRLVSDATAAWGTTLEEMLLAALALAFRREGTLPLRIETESHGRDPVDATVDVSRTVGWFTSLYPLTLSAPGDAVTTLKATKESLRRVPSKGMGFGLVRHFGPEEARKRLAALPPPKVLFNHFGRVDVDAGGPFAPLDLDVGASRCATSPRTHALEVVSSVHADRLSVSFTSAKSEAKRTEHLRDAFLDELRALVAACTGPGAGGFTPSDFPLAELAEHEVDRVCGAGRSVEDVYPLSSMQEAFFVAALAHEGRGLGVEQARFRLRGRLDVACFERAWRETIARQPVLRTRFVWRDRPRPLQVVDRIVAFAVDVRDARDRALDAREAFVEARALEDAAVGFDLAAAPLLRVSVVRTGEESFQVIVTHHHLLLDGWSLPLVVRDVVALYRAAVTGVRAALPPVRRYRDFVAHRLRQDSTAAIGHWVGMLEGAQGPTWLPLDRARVRRHAEGVGHRSLELPAAYVARAKEITHRTRATLGTILQGAWALLLSSYADTDDVLFGVTVSGRAAPLDGIESMLGLFINVVALRARVDAAATTDAFLSGLHAARLAGQVHENVPWTDVLEGGALPPHFARFGSLVVFENYPTAEGRDLVTHADGATLSVEADESNVRTGYAFTLVVVPGETLTLRLFFDGALVDEARADRLLQDLALVLERMVSGIATCAEATAAPAPPRAREPDAAVLAALAACGHAGAVDLRVVDRGGRASRVGLPGDLAVVVAGGELKLTPLKACLDGEGRVSLLGSRGAPLRVASAIGEAWPGEVEAALRNLDRVADAAVAERATEDGAYLLVAAVVPRSRAQLTDEAVLLQAREALATPLVPDVVVVVPHLKRQPDGTLDPAGLVSDEAFRRARLTSKTERELAAIWAKLLGTERPIGRDERFMELGGQSLLVIRMLARVRTAFGVDLPVRRVFEDDALSSIARAIDERREAAGLVVSNALPLRRLPARAHYRLSPYQLPEFYFSRLAPDSPMYNQLLAAFVLRGELDVDAFVRAYAVLVARHGVFRATFGLEDGVPVQYVRPELAVRREDIYVDRRHVGPDQFLAEARALAEEYGAKTLDFENGPMFHLKLVEYAGDVFQLIFLDNHILWDEASMMTFALELSATYRDLRAGREPALPPLAIDYFDYAEWVNDSVAANVYERERQYWLGQFASAPAPLELPIDFPRPAEQTFNGSAVPWTFSKETEGRLLHGLGRLFPDATLSMFLHATLVLLLHRVTNQADIVVGVPNANRSREELEGVLGPFATALPLRNLLREGMTFAELLADTARVTLEGLDHAAYPSVVAIQEINPDWDPSRGRLFSVMYGLQHNKLRMWSELEFEGTRKEWVQELSLVGPKSTTSRTDLRLLVDLWEGELGLEWAYNSDLFRRSTVERLAGSYERLLVQALDDPNKRVDQFDLVGGEERARILDGFNAGAPRIEIGPPAHVLVERIAAASPDANAVVEGTTRTCFGELDTRANRLARAIESRGVVRGDRVALHFTPSVDMLVAILAVHKLGAAYVPLAPEQPAARKSSILEQSAPRLVMTRACDEDGELASPALVLRLEDLRTELELLEGAPLSRHVDQDDAAVVFFTSGTTGTPKGIVLEHRGVTNLIESTQAAYPMGPSDATLFITPYTFDVSLLDIFWPLAFGAQIVVPAAHETKNPDDVGRLMADHPIAYLQCVPVMLAALVESYEAGRFGPPASLRGVMCAGAVMTRELRDRFARTFSAALFNHYGPTEATTDVTRFDTREDFDGDVVPIGTPITNTRVYVLDPSGTPVPPGVLGELYLSTPALARGYLGDPEKTAARFLPDPYSPTPGARMYRTGDLAKWSDAGVLYFVGRVDRQVKVRGNRVELEEIETRLAAHPAVRNCAVSHVPAGAGNDYLVAHVELVDGVVRPPDEHSVRSKTFVYTLAQRPDLAPSASALHADAWPSYFAGDEVMNRLWPRLLAELPEFQLAMVDESDHLLAVVNTVPVRWDGSIDGLPAGWDGALESAFDGRAAAGRPDTLVVLAGVTGSAASGRGLSAALVEAFKSLARSRGLARVLAPVRPVEKVSRPDVDFTTYCGLRRPDGSSVDRWIRVHERAGGRHLTVELRAQRVRAPLSSWSEWTGMVFETSGEVLVPDTLQPVRVDVAKGVAEYDDPCVWFEHDLGPEADPGFACVDPQSMKDHLLAALPDYMVPEHVRFVPRMPLTLTGKVDYAALPRASTSAVRRAHVPLETDLQRRLASIWTDVLGVEKVGATDDFFELGGHSIRAVQCMARIADELGVRLPLRTLFRAGSVRALEAEVARALGETAPLTAHEGQSP